MWVMEMYSSMGEACHYAASQRHDERVCVNRHDQSPMGDALVTLTSAACVVWLGRGEVEKASHDKE